MKTVRFSNVVDACGAPEPYLVLMEPAKDRFLQSAIKSNRVMTIFQDAVGNRADRGVVGFESGETRQFLIFPKSLRAFAGKTVVGIKYELWEIKEVPKSRRAGPVHPPKKTPQPQPQRPSVQSKESKPTKAPSPPGTGVLKPKSEPEPAEPPPSPANVVPFEPEPPADEEDTVTRIRSRIREAMDLLEQGKQVPAFNLLKKALQE